MTKSEFLAIAGDFLIIPDVLLEDDNIVAMLKHREPKEIVIDYIAENF